MEHYAIPFANVGRPPWCHRYAATFLARYATPALPFGHQLGLFRVPPLSRLFS